MTKTDKVIKKIASKPKDFTYNELRTLLTSVGCIEDNAGISSGSRVAFVHFDSGAILRLHKPHPGNELKIIK